MSFKEFKEKTLSSENAFLLNDGHGKILCVKVPIGQAEYVYAMREYLEIKEIVTNIYNELKMTAIVKDRAIYMIDPYNVTNNFSEEYPENVFYIDDDFLDEINLQIKNRVFDELYNSLETVTLTEYEKKICMKNARHILVYKKDVNKYISDNHNLNLGKISVQKFADSLCGIVNLDEEARKDFECKRDMWIKLKSSMELIKKFVTEKPEIILEKYEQSIIEGLHSVNSKTVHVEFLYNGKSAIGKVERDEILRILSANDNFSSHSFITRKSGDGIINELGAGEWRGDKKELLTCKHIIKITYGKKILYQRMEV